MPQERIYTPCEAIGEFKVVRLVDSGVLGTVYEAVPNPATRDDLLAMGIERVALKVARLDAVSRTPEERRQMVDRLHREYQTLLKLMNPGQPHLPEVYEFGWQEGVPFLAMEYVDGPTLEEVLAGQPPMQPMLEVFLKVCRVVAYLHGRGVVHRDLKPANVLMKDGEPSLIDLGHCLPPHGRRLTGPGELIGTALYASPQADGAALHPVSGRPYLGTAADDVWALGVFLYAVLTGDVPWRTPPHRRRSLVREMFRRKPRHPSDVNPAVPRALGDVALRLLEPDPARRPRDAAAVLELLEPVLRTMPVTGCVPARRGPGAAPAAGVRSEWIGAVARSWIAGGPRQKGLGLAAVVLLSFCLGAAGHRGLEELVKRYLGEPTPDAAMAGGAKPGASLPAALPVPSEPLPGQMQAPCLKKYVEASGGCWHEINGMTSDGKPLPCPDEDNVRELKEKNGRVRCLLAVMRKGRKPSSEDPVKGEH